MAKKKLEAVLSTAATTTTSVIPAQEDPVEVAKAIEKVEEVKEKKDFLNYCALCNKKLDAFVAANGLKFCSDKCMKEFFKA